MTVSQGPWGALNHTWGRERNRGEGDSQSVTYSYPLPHRLTPLPHLHEPRLAGARGVALADGLDGVRRLPELSWCAWM